MKKTLLVLTIASLGLVMQTSPVSAQGFHDQGFHDRWHGDIHHFDEHDFARWRGGSWYHGIHDGRDGWWWMIGDSWYYYPAPVYPYPDPYVPPVVLATPDAPVPGAAPSWYYCANPAGYYPYVAECFGHWRRVAAVATAPTVVVQQPPVVVEQPYPQPVAPAMSAQPASLREQDEGQLKAYRAELSSIDPHASHASVKLKDLGQQVEAFHQALFHRDYNAMDLLKNTEDLEKQISVAKALAKKKVVETETPPPMSTAPTPMPPPQ